MTIPAEPPAPPAPAEADPALGPMLNDFVACVCAELAAIGRPACACCLVWGDSVPPADFCDCDCNGGHGQAWVRVVRWDPPLTSNPQLRRRCVPWLLRVWVEVGVYRCVPAVAEDGTSAPSCDDRTGSAWGFIADARALRTAAACCQALDGKTIDFLQQEPTGNRGGCGGVSLQFTIDL